jgi:ElaB/YqjD/DUF883 family membrane-anchored ribosome-binding protein
MSVANISQQAQQQAQKVSDQAQGAIRQQVDTRSTQAGDQMASVGQSMRDMSQQLRGQGNDLPAQIVDQAAGMTERLSTYLRESDADQILSDVERFAREQPWAVAAVGILAGLAASRFIKASSRRRYAMQVNSEVQQPWQP